jgi:hypothetical protein
VVQRVKAQSGLAALACGTAFVLGAEWIRGGATGGAPPAWLTAEVVVMGAALLVAWHEQERLRLTPLLVLTAAYGLGIVLVHQAVGTPGDTDGAVYAAQGNLLLDGDYPRSEYPVGAVLLFGIDALLGGRSVQPSHALLMIPFQLVVVFAIFQLRSRWSAWLAALFALWPAVLYFVHMRFDVVVVALLVLGLLFGRRERWIVAGALLGAGTAVKWSPALACVLLVVWLLFSHRPREALRHATAFLAAFLAITVPFLVWQTSDVLAAYSKQSTRGIIAESLPYLPLRALGLAEPGPSGQFQDAALVPAWADPAAVVVQILVVLAVVGLIAWRRASLDGAVAAAALVPVVFLLTNRVFSPQFALVALAGWAFAIALVAHSRNEQLVLGVAAMTATYANAMVMPGFVGSWVGWSSLYFTISVALTGWLLLAAVDEPWTARPTRVSPASAT